MTDVIITPKDHVNAALDLVDGFIKEHRSLMNYNASVAVYVHGAPIASESDESVKILEPVLKERIQASTQFHHREVLRLTEAQNLLLDLLDTYLESENG